MTAEQQREYNRQWRLSHPGYFKRWRIAHKDAARSYWDNPHARAKRRAREKKRYHIDESYREYRKQNSRDYYNKTHNHDQL